MNTIWAQNKNNKTECLTDLHSLQVLRKLHVKASGQPQMPYPVVDVHKVTQLLGQDTAPVPKRQLSTRNNHTECLLQVDSCSLKESQHKVLETW